MRSWYGRAVAMAAVMSSPLEGQAELLGRVLTDSGRTPVAGAVATFPQLSRSATADSTGGFRLKDLPAGMHLLIVRAVGFAPDSSAIELASNDVVAMEFRLRPSATSLPERTITGREDALASGKMAGFHERKNLGVGRFVTREMLEKAEASGQTGNELAKVPGLVVKRGGSKAWIATGRAVSGGGPAFRAGGGLNAADFAAGARPACYMDVYLDGMLVYSRSQGVSTPLFDINSIPPAHIEGIEIYTSAAQVPAQFNRTSSGCGVMLLWTR